MKGRFGDDEKVEKVEKTLMIEAVNSTVVNAALLRNVAEQATAASIPSVSAVLPIAPEGAPDVPQAPFVSPYISVDLNFDKAVLQIRDSETGDVEQQFPTESRLAQIRRAQDSLERAEIRQDAGTRPTSGESTSTAQTTVQDIETAPLRDITPLQQNTPSGNSAPLPQIAIAALSTGAQSGQTAARGSSGVSVLA